MYDPHTDFYYPTTIDYWVTITEYLITFPLSETVTAHAPCHVTSNRGAKIIYIFEIPDPNLPIHFVTFRVLRRRWSHVIAFSHYEGYRVYCACALSRDLCIGGPPKPHVTIFWPRIAYSLYNFYGATMTIKSSFILEHPHVKAVFGGKKTKSSQNRVPKWRFLGNLRVKI